MPREHHDLINPLHPDIARVSVEAPQPLSHYARMFEGGVGRGTEADGYSLRESSLCALDVADSVSCARCSVPVCACDFELA
jgi:hypothetical protein